VTGRRLGAAHGSELPQAKLNEKLVLRVRAEHAAKERMKRWLDQAYGSAALARRYGVSKNTMDKVLSYQTWRHVR